MTVERWGDWQLKGWGEWQLKGGGVAVEIWVDEAIEWERHLIIHVVP